MNASIPSKLLHPHYDEQMPKQECGTLTSLARYIRIVEVTGSNPVCSTTPNGIVETGNPVFCIFSNDFTADSP